MTALEVRPDLENLEPYVSPQREGWTGLRMNTNESPYAPPEPVIEDLLSGLRRAAFNRYPERDAADLVGALARHLDHPREGLWLANGSNEVFLHLFLAFGGPGRSVMVFEPTYSLHSLIPRLTGTRVIARGRDDFFAIDLDETVEAIEVERPDLIILCSPNNPTGGVEARPTVQAILEHAPGLVVVDEAYGEFAPPEASVRPLLGSEASLVVVKTFSKAWSLAGARLGYLMASPQIVKDLARVRLPYHLSTPTQLLGEAVLDHIEEMGETIDKVTVERDRLAIGLQALGIKTYPSSANFVLFEVEEPGEVWDALLTRGVLIRRYEGVPRLERCLRVTAGLPAETDAFLSAIEAVMSEL